MQLTPSAPVFRVRWRIFSFLFGFGLVAYVQQKTITVAAAQMMPELGLSQLQISWLMNAFVLGYAVFQIPGGILGQRWGARRTFVIIGLTAFLATVATPLAPYFCSGRSLFIALLLIQLLLGCSQGAIFPVSAGVFESWFPPHRWSLVQGLQTMGLGLGAALTPPLITQLTVHWGWQRALLLASVPALALIAGWAWYGRNAPRQHPQMSARELAEIGTRYAAAAPGAAPRLAEFLRLFRNRSVLLLAVAYLCMNYTFYLLSNFTFLYLIEERRFSQLDGGFLAMAPPLAAALGAGVGGALTGLLCRHLGELWGFRLVPLLALPASAALLLVAVTAANPYAAVAALALCFGCVELTEGAFWGAGMSIGGEDTMAVCGFMNTGGNLGGLIGIPIIGYFSDRHLWTVAFLIGIGFALVSAVAWFGIVVAPREPSAVQAPVELASGASAA